MPSSARTACDPRPRRAAGVRVRSTWKCAGSSRPSARSHRRKTGSRSASGRSSQSRQTSVAGSAPRSCASAACAWSSMKSAAARAQVALCASAASASGQRCASRGRISARRKLRRKCVSRLLGSSIQLQSMRLRVFVQQRARQIEQWPPQVAWCKRSQCAHAAKALRAGAAQQFQQHGFGLVVAMMRERENFPGLQVFGKRREARLARRILDAGAGMAGDVDRDDFNRNANIQRARISRSALPSARCRHAGRDRHAARAGRAARACAAPASACSSTVESMPPLKPTTIACAVSGSCARPRVEFVRQIDACADGARSRALAYRQCARH